MIVDQTEPCATSATKLRLEAEKHNLIDATLVHLGDLFLEIGFGNAWDQGTGCEGLSVIDVDDHLTTM